MIATAAPRLRAVRNYIRARQRRDRLLAIHARYAAFTMIPCDDYVLNLELAEQVRSVPGDVVECGVWRGGMIAGIADVLGAEREYVLCDSFEGLPPAQVIDGQAALGWQRNVSGPNYHDNCTAPEATAREAMRQSAATRTRFVAGWFEATLPLQRFDRGIALLRLDADWYSSTMTCLEQLYSYVLPGGLILIDDYYTWDGCARAVHQFLAQRRLSVPIRQWGGIICYLRVPGTTAASDAETDLSVDRTGTEC